MMKGKNCREPFVLVDCLLSDGPVLLTRLTLSARGFVRGVCFTAHGEHFISVSEIINHCSAERHCLSHCRWRSRARRLATTRPSASARPCVAACPLTCRQALRLPILKERDRERKKERKRERERERGIKCSLARAGPVVGRRGARAFDHPRKELFHRHRPPSLACVAC
jgi:hypothetical protein